MRGQDVHRNVLLSNSFDRSREHSKIVYVIRVGINGISKGSWLMRKFFSWFHSLMALIEQGFYFWVFWEHILVYGTGDRVTMFCKNWCCCFDNLFRFFADVHIDVVFC